MLGCQDRREAVVVGRQLGGEPWEQAGQDVLTAAAAEEPLRVPGGVEYHQPLAAPHAQGPAEPLTVGAGGQHAVEARIAREYGRTHRFGACAAQPLQLLRVGQYEAVHERLAVRQEPLG
ncbi:hypothetical protein ACIA6C_23365 [Streptomyces sp. NPDC051578]|uniref:hypothetical protein n=1 Tax=Streptomyces sp. NPDC051578 TaxID=3365662 RepID=UPI00379F2909